MKKLVFLLTLVMALGFFAFSAQADVTFGNNTYVQEWNKDAPYKSGAWRDVIGAESVYETFGGVLRSSGILEIYTNWDGPGYTDIVDGATVVAADLFIDAGADGIWDFAIGMRNVSGDNRLGNVYYIGTHKTSRDLFKSHTSLIYGGQYDTDGNPSNGYQAADVPVEAGGTSFDTTTVTWTGTLDPRTVQITLTGITGFNPNAAFSFLWATGTCANDTALASFTAGNVPLPGALLLLGAGLARLAAYARKRREE